MSKTNLADRSTGGDTFEFYKGAATLKKRMYGTAPSFKRTDGESTILSVTRCTGKLDKAKVLIPWACGLVATHITSAIEASTAPHFLKDEILLLVGEARLAPDRKRDEGAEAGNLIQDYAHEFATMKIAGKKGTPSLKHLDESNEVHARALNGISAFLDWYNTNDVTFLEMEKLVYYNSLLAGDTKKNEEVVEFYGFIDLVAKVNGKLAIVDYKSSKGIYNEQRYQVAGYKKAYDACVGKTDLGLIVNFHKETGEVMTKELPQAEFEKDYAAFLGLYHVACRERELEAEYKASQKRA